MSQALEMSFQTHKLADDVSRFHLYTSQMEQSPDGSRFWRDMLVRKVVDTCPDCIPWQQSGTTRRLDITRTRLMPSLLRSKASLPKSPRMRLCMAPAVLRQLLSRLADLKSASVMRRKDELSLPSHRRPSGTSKPPHSPASGRSGRRWRRSMAAVQSVVGTQGGSLTALKTARQIGRGCGTDSRPSRPWIQKDKTRTSGFSLAASEGASVYGDMGLYALRQSQT
jgi:hypothetical protein